MARIEQTSVDFKGAFADIEGNLTSMAGAAIGSHLHRLPLQWQPMRFTERIYKNAMARNIEIKARIENIALMAARVAAIADKGPIKITQDDTFFPCANGRLKLRIFSPDRGELIYYRRADQKGPKESFYLVSHTSSPETLRDLLSLAYGQVGRVRKHRTLFLAGRTRIHLDRVQGLGDFLELEVVLQEGEDAARGEDIAHALMRKLGIFPEQLIEGAYVDLLTASPR